MNKSPAASTRARGAAAEQLAVQYLQRAGLRLIRQNYSVRGGELDLVMQDGESLVFVEVRHRVRATHGTAADTVTSRKQRRVLIAAQHFLQNHPAWARQPCRFDVLALQGELAAAEMHWIQNAFQA